MRRFAVCFHHTNEDLKVWERFTDYLSKKFGEDFHLVTYLSFLEERKRSRREDYDLVFQNPETVFILLERGYLPVARFDNQWDTVYYLRKKNYDKDKKLLKVGIVPIRSVYSTLLELENIGFDIDKLDFIVYQSLKDIHSALLNDEIDIGITRKDTFSLLPEDFKSQMEILLEFSMGIFHSFMVKSTDIDFRSKMESILFNMHSDPEGLAIIKDLDSDKIVPIGYEFGFLDRLNKIGEKIFEYRNFRSFFKVIDQVTNIGVIIYGNTVKYANKYALDFLKYNEEELYKLDVVELFEKSKAEFVKSNVSRRLAGEFFDVKYKNIKMVARDGEILDVEGFASTVIFHGKPSGTFIFIDNRKNIFLEKLFSGIKELNHIITFSDDKEEVFKKLGENITTVIGFCFSRVIYYENGLQHLEYTHGTSLKLLEKIEINDKNIMMDIVSNDIGNIKAIVFVVPIFIDDRLIAIIEVHTQKYINFLNELVVLMEELKSDVTFILQKIEKDEKALWFYNAIKSSKDLCFITDYEGKILFHNEAVAKLSGYSSEEIIGKTPAIFKSGRMSRDFYDRFYEQIKSGKEFNGIFINKTKSGSLFYLDTTVMPIMKNDTIKGYVSIGKNITNEILLQNEIDRVRYEDHLTGLYNYLGFQQKANEFLKSNPESISAFVLVDIHNMSFINNTYGFAFGDEVLKIVGNSLKKLTKERDIISRIGGDDFAILFSNIKKKENIIKIVDRLSSFFQKKFLIENETIYINVKISVVIYPFDGKDILNIMNKASLVLSQMKKMDEVIQFYDPDLEKQAEQYMVVEDLLSTAIEEDRYILHYQPYFYADTLELAGFEALIRLKDKEGKIVYPGFFIDHLEQSKYIDSFEKWLIKEVSELIKETGYNISINISAKGLDFDSFVSKFYHLTPETSERLTIEITEREVNDNTDLFVDQFYEFKKKMSLKLALDDFGTGYSSLSRLKYLPCDVLKIDMSFIRDILKSEKDAAYVNAMIDLGKRFGYTTLAEGVETLEQLIYLKNNGCDIIQGYLLGKPMDIDTLLHTDWKGYSENLRKQYLK